MKIVKQPRLIQQICLQFRKKNKTIGVVPTMGFLHEGHLTLLKKCRAKCDILILTLFINPTQFGPKEDLSRYPTDIPGDLSKARVCGVDYVFMPKARDMYPADYQTFVEVGEMTQTLCGASRPGHFKGVTTIVAKLFHLTQPDMACFGLKDFQQFAVLKKMVKDLNMPIKMVGVPTVRESDGLAKSSRNSYLNSGERVAALCLSKAIQQLKDEIKKGETDLKKLEETLKINILKEPLAQMDYVTFVDSETLKPLQTYKKGKTLFALAVFIGKTRLIDNVVV